MGFVRLFQTMPDVNAKVKKPRRTPREWFKKYFLEGNLHLA